MHKRPTNHIKCDAYACIHQIFESKQIEYICSIVLLEHHSARAHLIKYAMNRKIYRKDALSHLIAMCPIWWEFDAVW